MAANAFRSSRVLTPPEAINGKSRGGQDLGQPLAVGAEQGSVPADLGDDGGGQRRAGETVEHLGDAHAGALLPAPHPDLAVSMVDTDRHPARIGPGQGTDGLGILDGQAPDDDPGHTPVEQGAVPHPAADLDRDRQGGGQAGDDGPIVALAASGVEVDHVDPLGAGVDEAAGDEEGIVAVDGLPVEISLHQADASPSSEVDGGVEVHQPDRSTAATKLASSCNPTVLDFSGWNWVAHSESRPTAAVTVPP